MKLRNKKTGVLGTPRVIYQEFHVVDENGYTHDYESLRNMHEEWEDYEGPKGIQCIYYVNHFDAARLDGVIVGFETKEEAELAVRKLKAWKRLKDKGFRFEYYDYSDRDLHNHIQIKAITNREVEDSMLYKEDLDLLFGGGE